MKIDRHPPRVCVFIGPLSSFLSSFFSFLSSFFFFPHPFRFFSNPRRGEDDVSRAPDNRQGGNSRRKLEFSSSQIFKSSPRKNAIRFETRDPLIFFSNKLRDLSFVDFFSEYYNHFQYFSCFCFLFLYQLYKHSSSETYEFLISRDILSLKFKFF